MKKRKNLDAKFHFTEFMINHGETQMTSLKQLEQEKAALELKIAQSIEAAKKVDEDLDKARIRYEAIKKGKQEIQDVLDKYGLLKEDVFPSPGIKTSNKQPLNLFDRQGQTLKEMRDYFATR